MKFKNTSSLRLVCEFLAESTSLSRPWEDKILVKRVMNFQLVTLIIIKIVSNEMVYLIMNELLIVLILILSINSGQEIVNDTKVYKNTVQGDPRGSFSCPCGIVGSDRQPLRLSCVQTFFPSTSLLMFILQ